MIHVVHEGYFRTASETALCVRLTQKCRSDRQLVSASLNCCLSTLAKCWVVVRLAIARTAACGVERSSLRTILTIMLNIYGVTPVSLSMETRYVDEMMCACCQLVRNGNVININIHRSTTSYRIIHMYIHTHVHEHICAYVCMYLHSYIHSVLTKYAITTPISWGEMQMASLSYVHTYRWVLSVTPVLFHYL
jgi:hypothetical protein